MRWGRRTLLVWMIAAAAGCTQESSAPGADDRPVVLPSTLDWPAVDGAVQYRVQVWDGVRLLFEETRDDARLLVTPSMERSLRGADSAQLRVQALGPDGRNVGEPVVRELAGRDG